MNKKSKFTLLFVLILFFMMASGLVLFIDASRSTASAHEAHVSAESYSVGVDYTGVITEQFVEPGDRVSSGQTLFYIESNVLRERMRELDIQKEDLLYPLNDKGEIVIRATKAGVVSRIEYLQGSFVPANKEIATIIDESSVYAIGVYRLARRDFAKLHKGSRMDIRLPNGTIASGTLSFINVLEQKEIVVAEIKSDLQNVDVSQFLSSTGTPVSAKLHLNETTLFDRLYSFVSSKVRT